jgi:hypothetical protein
VRFFPDSSIQISGLIWVVLLVFAAIVITIPTPMAIKSLVLSAILRFIFSFGPELTLTILGFAIVRRSGLKRTLLADLIKPEFRNLKTLRFNIFL